MKILEALVHSMIYMDFNCRPILFPLNLFSFLHSWDGFYHFGVGTSIIQSGCGFGPIIWAGNPKVM